MDFILHKFRNTLFGGFNRKDVLTFIERSSKEATEKIQDLTARLEQTTNENNHLIATLNSLRSESGDLAQQESEARASLEECTKNLSAVREELELTRTQLTRVKQELSDLQTKVEQIEPMARRYEALKNRIATVELDAHQKAQATIDGAQQEVEAIYAEADRWLNEIQMCYQSLRTQIGHSISLASSMEESFAAMDKEYQALIQRRVREKEKVLV